MRQGQVPKIQKQNLYRRSIKSERLITVPLIAALALTACSKNTSGSDVGSAPSLPGKAIVNAAICQKVPDLTNDKKLWTSKGTIQLADLTGAVSSYTTEQRAVCTYAYMLASYIVKTYQAGARQTVPGLKRHASGDGQTYGVWITEPIARPNPKSTVAYKVASVVFNVDSHQQPNYSSIYSIGLDGYKVGDDEQPQGAPIDTVTFSVPAEQGSQPWDMQRTVTTLGSNNHLVDTTTKFAGILNQPSQAQAAFNQANTMEQFTKIDTVFGIVNK